MSGRSIWAFAVGAAALLVARTTHAQVPTSPIVWTAPEGCPTHADVVDDVERLLGRPLANALPNGFHVEVTIEEKVDRSFHARALFASGSDPREVEGASCDAVAEALTVMITVAIDPNADLVPVAAESTATPVVAPPPQLVATDHPDGVFDSDLHFVLHGKEVVPFELRLDLGVGVSGSALPGAGASVHFDVGIRDYLFVAHAALAYSFARTTDDDRADFNMVRGSLAAGLTFLPSRSPLWIEVLLAFEVARIEGRSLRVSSPETNSGQWVGAGLDARLRYELAENFGLYASLAAMVAIDRPHFEISGIGTIFTSSRVDARAEFGMTVRFGS